MSLDFNECEAAALADDPTERRRHADNCPDCRELAVFWMRLGELPEATPDPRARQRFDQMLSAYQAGHAAHRQKRPNWFASLAWHPMPAMAAVVLLAAGVAAGWFLHHGPETKVQNDSQQIAELRDQVQSTRQLAVLSLLQQQSANDRLQGVTYSARLDGTDPEVTGALLHSLKYDPSPDVRLAVVDTLSHFGNQPEVRQGLVDAFHYQQSPMVQIALMDSFLETRDQQARSLLEQISKDKAYNPAVRQRAVWSLAQPAWN